MQFSLTKTKADYSLALGQALNDKFNHIYQIFGTEFWPQTILKQTWPTRLDATRTILYACKFCSSLPWSTLQDVLQSDVGGNSPTWSSRCRRGDISRWNSDPLAGTSWSKPRYEANNALALLDNLQALNRVKSTLITFRSIKILKSTLIHMERFQLNRTPLMDLILISFNKTK